MKKTLKIRIYSPGFPLPITEGMHQIVADQLETFLSMGHDVELVSILESMEEVRKKAPTELAEFEARGLKLTSLASQKPSAMARTWRVGSSLLSSLASPEIHYYPPRPQRKENWSEVSLAIYHYSFSYAWLRERNRRNEAKQVVYLHNLESELFDLRVRDEKSFLKRMIHSINAEKLRRHERQLNRFADELWFLSPIDRKALLPWAHDKLLRLTPPGYDQRIRERRQRAFEVKGMQAKTVCAGFIGGLDFLPNHDSAKWILEYVAPALASAGFNGKLVIAGRGAREELKRLGERFSFVEFTGFVQDLEDYWSRLSLSLVPHVSGSGVRMKLLESVASGVPVLANTEAIKRLHPDVQKSPFVVRCDEIEDWVRVLISEKPMQSRRALLSEPHNSGLQGSKIYEFLSC